MRKSFSLIELIISMGILSFVILSFYQIKDNNLYLMEKTNNTKTVTEQLILAVNSDEKFKKEGNIYLDKYFAIEDDDIRRSLKEIKIITSYDSLKNYQQESSSMTLNIEEFKSEFKIENQISKNIYRFELKL